MECCFWCQFCQGYVYAMKGPSALQCRTALRSLPQVYVTRGVACSPADRLSEHGAADAGYSPMYSSTPFGFSSAPQVHDSVQSHSLGCSGSLLKYDEIFWGKAEPSKLFSTSPFVPR